MSAIILFKALFWSLPKLFCETICTHLANTLDVFIDLCPSFSFYHCMFPPPSHPLASPFPCPPHHSHAKSTPVKETGTSSSKCSSLLSTWLSSSAETRGRSLAVSPSHLHSSGTLHFKSLIQKLTTKRRSLQWDQLCEYKLRRDRFSSANSHGAVRIKHPHNLCLCVEKNRHKRQTSKLWSSLEFIVNMSTLLFESFLQILSFYFVI